MKHTERLRNNLKFKPLHLALYALILGLAGYIIIISRAAPPPPTVYLTPTIRTMAAGTTFSVQLRANSGTTAINAVQGTFTYPESLLEYVSMDAVTGSAYGVNIVKKATPGEISIASSVSPGDGVFQTTGDQLVATITFKAKTTTGAAALTFKDKTTMLDATSSQNILPSLTATGGATITVDTTAPTVTVSSPASGATIAGGTAVAVNGTVSDNTGTVSSTTVTIDGNLKQTFSGNSFNYSWTTNGVALGAHTIDVRATDPYGNVSASSPRTVTLVDQTAPSVSLTAPTTGQTVKGSIDVTATASDNSGGTGINRVEFYLDGATTPSFSDPSSPYTWTQWNSKTVSDGNHTLSVKAFDNATPANASTLSSVTITVENTDKQAPSTPTNLRATANGLNNIGLAWTASTDNVGVTGYRIQRGGTTIATITSTTYNDAGLTSGTSYNYSVVAIDATNNTSSAATLTTSTSTVKLGDTDNDNVVGLKDLSNLIINWEKPYPPGDFNKTGAVDLYDLSVLISNWTR